MSNHPQNYAFLSLPSKRAIISDHTTLSPPKRPKHHLQPPPAGHASLRILCHVSTVSAFIGKSGSTIKQLQSDTRSKIRVDDSLTTGSDRRVIVIVAPSVPSQPVKVRKNEDEEVEYEEEVSPVQVAALRVFEKLLEVAKEEEKKTVTCRVLIEASQAGFVIGKGGKMVEKLKRDSGAKIRVLLGDSLPPDVSPLDEVVEIEGDVFSVKKGLLGVCGRLQQCPSEDKSSKKESKPIESTSQPTMRDYQIDPPLQRTQLYAMSASPALVVRPLSYEAQRSPLFLTTTSSSPATLAMPSSFEADVSGPVTLKSQQEVVFKLLCPNDRVGGVIGRGGHLVRALQEETGASISVGPKVADCDERLVTITSKEDVDSRYSPAQRAAVLVYSRSAEATAVKGHEASSKKGSSISARLLVPLNQVGCLLGKGGAVVSEMRKATGANISILIGEQLPKCALEDERVVEITGQFVKIQDALYQVTSRLRSNLFPSKVTSVPGSQTSSSLIPDTTLHGRVRDQIPVDLHQSFTTSQSIDGLPTTGLDFDSLRYPRVRVRDQIPIDVHQSFATSQSVDRLSMARHDLDSLRYPHVRVRDEIPIDLHQSLATSQSIDGLSTTRCDLDSLARPQKSVHSPSTRYIASEADIGVNHRSCVNLGRGLAPANGGIELGSANRPAIVTNTTVEISVPESAIGSVYGENGRNLTRIRQISGAKVSVHEARPGTRDWTVVISGSPEETQAAQSLIHAFILTGSS